MQIPQWDNIISMQILNHVLSSFTLEPYFLQSRLHRLRHFGTEQLFLKRDDELSFGVSGSKLRKYASLLPYLKSQNFSKLILTGNIYSNHILGFTQLAIQKQIPLEAYLKGDPSQVKGNALYTRLLLPLEKIHWVHKTQDPYEVACQHYRSTGDVFVLPEGGSCLASLPGAMTLALDLLRHEQELETRISDLFVDAGTGLGAIALILGLSLAKHDGTVHVLLLADSEEIFLRKLHDYKHQFELWTGLHIPLTVGLVLEKPQTAQSFGSSNQTIKQEILQMARQEGVICDPIYSAKLTHHVRHKIPSLSKDALKILLHSGGGLSLSGFEFPLD